MRVERFSSNKNHFNLYVDRNSSVYDIKRITVLSWKKNKYNKTVPAETSEERDVKLFDELKGRPYPLVVKSLLTKFG